MNFGIKTEGMFPPDSKPKLTTVSFAYSVLHQHKMTKVELRGHFFDSNQSSSSHIVDESI